VITCKMPEEDRQGIRAHPSIDRKGIIQ